jgi:hypothetical protein
MIFADVDQPQVAASSSLTIQPEPAAHIVASMQDQPGKAQPEGAMACASGTVSTLPFRLSAPSNPLNGVSATGPTVQQGPAAPGILAFAATQVAASNSYTELRGSRARMLAYSKALAARKGSAKGSTAVSSCADSAIATPSAPASPRSRSLRGAPSSSMGGSLMSPAGKYGVGLQHPPLTPDSKLQRQQRARKPQDTCPTGTLPTPNSKPVTSGNLLRSSTPSALTKHSQQQPRQAKAAQKQAVAKRPAAAVRGPAATAASPFEASTVSVPSPQSEAGPTLVTPPLASDSSSEMHIQEGSLSLSRDQDDLGGHLMLPCPPQSVLKLQGHSSSGLLERASKMRALFTAPAEVATTAAAAVVDPSFTDVATPAAQTAGTSLGAGPQTWLQDAEAIVMVSSSIGKSSAHKVHNKGPANVTARSPLTSPQHTSSPTDHRTLKAQLAAKEDSLQNVNHALARVLTELAKEKQVCATDWWLCKLAGRSSKIVCGWFGGAEAQCALSNTHVLLDHLRALTTPFLSLAVVICAECSSHPAGQGGAGGGGPAGSGQAVPAGIRDQGELECYILSTVGSLLKHTQVCTHPTAPLKPISSERYRIILW